MYNSSPFNKKQMMEWEDKDDVNKTWVAYKMFFKKYYELKKCYSNVKPVIMGFERHRQPVLKQIFIIS